MGNRFTGQVLSNANIGVFLDERMSWDQHIENICRKSGGWNSRYMKRIKPFVPNITLQMILMS
jgi:hypothetical protein